MLLLTKQTAGRKYWTWIACLAAVITAGLVCYFRQLDYGLGLTGMSRDVTWGLYIGQFTFLVGIAASAVMLVLPYYLHDYKPFAKLVLFGELVAISAVAMSMLFIFVDMGQPSRVLNVLLHPAPGSIMFWDMVSLGGYLALNAIIARAVLRCERHDVPPPRWLRPVSIVSIPWAISIHTVTAFLYCGLPGRSFWLTAIMAPRFLASAFASGPALLILLCLAARKMAGVGVTRKAIDKLTTIVTYAMLLNVFFVALEIFTVFYSRIPEDIEHFRYLFLGLDGDASLVPWMWSALTLALVSLVLLLAPGRNDSRLAAACAAIFVSLWIDKGLAMVVAGFVPSPLGVVTRYSPTVPEVAIAAGVWAAGALTITICFRLVMSTRVERYSGSMEVSH